MEAGLAVRGAWSRHPGECIGGDGDSLKLEDILRIYSKY